MLIYFIYLTSCSHNSLPGWKMLHPCLGSPPHWSQCSLDIHQPLVASLLSSTTRYLRLILSISCSILGNCCFYKTSWFFLVGKNIHGLYARGAHCYFIVSAFVGVGLRNIYLLRDEKSGFYTNTSNSNLRL